MEDNQNPADSSNPPCEEGEGKSLVIASTFLKALFPSILLPCKAHPSSKVEEEFCKQSSVSLWPSLFPFLALLTVTKCPLLKGPPFLPPAPPPLSFLKGLKRDSIERQIQFNSDKRRRGVRTGGGGGWERGKSIFNYGKKSHSRARINRLKRR